MTVDVHRFRFHRSWAKGDDDPDLIPAGFAPGASPASRRSRELGNTFYVPVV